MPGLVLVLVLVLASRLFRSILNLFRGLELLSLLSFFIGYSLHARRSLGGGWLDIGYSGLSTAYRSLLTVHRLLLTGYPEVAE